MHIKKLSSLCFLLTAAQVLPAGAETPHIFWASDPVGPDETVLVQGSEFEGAKVELSRLADGGQDVKAHPQALEVLQGSASSLKFIVHYTHEGGISTPLIVHWPAGISAKGELRAQRGHLTDIMATVVEVTGAPYPARSPSGVPITPMEGKSLLPIFAGQTLQRGPIFWEHYGSAAVRDGKWKLVRANRVAAWELYDMETDRAELDNLGASQLEKVKNLVNQWEA